LWAYKRNSCDVEVTGIWVCTGRTIVWWWYSDSKVLETDQVRINPNALLVDIYTVLTWQAPFIDVESGHFC